MAISDMKIQISDPFSVIGKKVKKESDRKFKSGEKINTVKGVTIHPTLQVHCFTFEEDESMVEVRRCEVVE